LPEVGESELLRFRFLTCQYLADKYAGEMAEVQAIILPQPELFLSPDSQYKGMKPDNMKMITDSMRQIFAETFAESYQIANSPGPNTLVLELAFSNLHLKKKPRAPVIGWLPPAYVVTCPWRIPNSSSHR